MSVLANPKHERFAQELAKGQTADEAYQLAGYAENRGNAIRLKANERIRERVTEIQDRGAIRAEVTVDSLISEAGDIQTMALADKQYGAAIAALTAKAKLAGKWVDRSEQGKPGDFERMTDAELAGYVAAEAAALGVSPAGAEAPNDQASMRGQPSRVH